MGLKKEIESFESEVQTSSKDVEDFCKAPPFIRNGDQPSQVGFLKNPPILSYLATEKTRKLMLE